MTLSYEYKKIYDSAVLKVPESIKDDDFRPKKSHFRPYLA